MQRLLFPFSGSLGHAVACLCRAAKAAASGLFDAEIIPVTTTVKDAGGQVKTVTVKKQIQAVFTGNLHRKLSWGAPPAESSE